MKQDLVRAIADKRLVQFTYKAGRPRVVEPHDYGIRHGVECLLGFQISGESQSGAPQGWKQFDVDQIHRLRVLDVASLAREPTAHSTIAPGTCYLRA